MGIEKFFVTVNKKYDISSSVKSPKSIKKLYIDFNGLIHQSYRGIKELNNINVINETINILFNILKLLCDKNTLSFLYLSIDGTVSLAKMLEQQQRRYLRELDDIITNKLYNLSEIKWVSYNVSPGTAFMDELCLSLSSKSFLGKLLAEFPNCKLQISDIYDPGEGEMKIINNIKKLQQFDEPIYIYSGDGDFLILSLLIPCEIFIIKKDPFNDDTIILDMYKLKQSILDFIMDKKPSLDPTKAINDLMLIFTLFGNDFLPKIKTISVERDIEMLLDFYSKLDEYIIEDGVLNFIVLFKFLKYIANTEQSLLLKNYLNGFINFRPIYNNIKHINRDIGYTEVLQFINDYNSGKIRYNKVLGNKIELFTKNDIRNDKHQQNMAKLDDLGKKKYKIENLLIKSEIYEFYDIDIYRKLYNEKSTKKIVFEYLLGWLWVYNYYYLGKQYYDWCYDNLVPPLIMDILDIFESYPDIIVDCETKLHTYLLCPSPIIAQLLFIIPPSPNLRQLFVNKYDNDDIETILAIHKNLKHPNLHEIANDLLNGQFNPSIDCTMALYFNKCHIHIQNQLNVIRSLIVDKLGDAKLMRYSSLQIGGYIKYKKLYVKSGNKNYKKKYKYYKQFI